MSVRLPRAAARPFRRVAVVLTGTLLAVSALGAAPAFAVDTVDTYVTMLGGGDYIGGSMSQLFHPGNGTVTVSGGPSLVTFDVSGGTHGDYYDLNFKAPDNEPLAPGVYDGAMRYPFQTGGRPGISVFGSGRGCNQVSGRFVVHDVAFAEGGAVTRFLATYEHFCEGRGPALLGTVSFNQPGDPELLVAGVRMGWPESYRGVDGRTLPVWLVNRGTSTITVSGAALGGTDAADWTVVANGCGTIAAGATCAIHLKFRAGAAGERSATLTLTDSTTAGTHAVALSGRGIPGHTAVYFRSDTGDYIGQGQERDWTPANATFGMTGSSGGISMRVDSGSEYYTIDIRPPSGGVLAPGAYPGATDTTSATTPYLDVSGSGRGCTVQGSFTVIEAAFKDGTGPVERFSATFEQHCGTATAALRGWVSWRATDANVPGGEDPGGGGSITSVTGLTAEPDVASVILGWNNPAEATSVVVRGAAGLTAPATPTSGAAIFTGLTEAVVVRYLMPGTSYSFSVFAKDAGGDTAAPAKITLRGTDLTLSRGASTVTYGTASPVSVKLVDTVTGAARPSQDVDLYARPKGSRQWQWVDTLTTGSNGVATISLTFPSNYELQATYYGNGHSLGATAGPVGVSVRMRITTSMSRTNVARYGSVTIRGGVAPSKAGKTVYLQKYVSGAWKNYASATLSATSTYAFTIRPGTAGTWKLRVYRPGDTLHVSSASATRTLTVT